VGRPRPLALRESDGGPGGRPWFATPSLQCASVERVFGTGAEELCVLGVDPGVSRCGYGAVTGRSADLRAVAAGVITTEPSAPLEERLLELLEELRGVLREIQPDAVAVERVLFQVNARTAMSVGQAAGLALVAAAERCLPVATYSANEVKQAVTGWGGATKQQVQRMVAALCHLEEFPRPPDVADALGLAICHLAMARHEQGALAGARPGRSRRGVAGAAVDSPLGPDPTRRADGR
jgi:crossover junction endodeoxyribonuclease RuvC